MKKTMITLLFAFSCLLANPFQQGDSLDLTFQDQFEKPLEVTDGSRYFLLATSKATGKTINAFIEEQGHEILENKKIIYASDVSSVPSLVMSLFMMPKFEEYPYKMALIEEEETAKRFPVKADHFTLLELDKKKITTIHFLDTKEALLETIQ